MRQYIYIDESGDPGEDGSKHLIIAAVLVKNPALLDRIIKNMRRNKFKKELKKAREIKANSSSEEVIVHILEQLNKIPYARVFAIVLEKRKLRSTFLQQEKHKLYNFVSGKLADEIARYGDDFEVRVDRSKNKLLQKDFNDYFKKKISYKTPRAKIDISHSYSEAWSGLQFADIVAWSIFQKFENSNEKYFDTIDIPKEVRFVFPEKKDSTNQNL